MGFSLGLSAYLLLSDRLEGLANRKLESRLAEGKEHPERINERRGKTNKKRPPGTLIWFHAASVGESLSLVNLIEQILDDFPDLNVLMTTGTRTSADLIKTRLPPQTIHQFVPLDARPFVRKFLDHWQPDVAIWTESELWPTLIAETKRRGTHMLLLNARMSRKSHDAWRWVPGIAAALLRSFDEIFVQDQTTAKYLRRLGAYRDKISVTGSLKESSGALPHDEAERARLAENFKTRPVWLAASTHPGEEAMAAQAHKQAIKAAHRLLLILAPRHPERGPEIARELRDDGWNVAVRSDGDDPDPATQIYIADTLGEMGLWFRLAPLTFLGGSLVNIGGHNPFEPAALGSAILHGPHVISAAEIYARLGEAGGALQVSDTTELGQAVVNLLEPHRAAELAHAAWEVTSSGAGATERALIKITEMIDHAEARR